jgi:hypothetical protein
MAEEPSKYDIVIEQMYAGEAELAVIFWHALEDAVNLCVQEGTLREGEWSDPTDYAGVVEEIGKQARIRKIPHV